MSGNGTRIAARWLAGAHRRGRGRACTSARARSRCARARRRARRAGPRRGRGRRRASASTGSSSRRSSVGNPHAVVVGDPDDVPRIGPLLETHPRFPNRTNVQVARVDGPGEVTARVWERGVGETSSSGTSAVAVAAATHGEGDVRRALPGRRPARAARGRPGAADRPSAERATQWPNLAQPISYSRSSVVRGRRLHRVRGAMPLDCAERSPMISAQPSQLADVRRPGTPSARVPGTTTERGGT